MRTRRLLSPITVLGLAGVVLLVVSVPGGAGVSTGNSIIVNKVVNGTAPSGSQYTVVISCPDAVPAPYEQTLQFTGPGSQTLSNASFNAVEGAPCTATETVTGGATSSSVACSNATGSSQCSGANTFEFLPDGVENSSVTITVTNTYAPAEVISQARLTG